ncbi:DnaJ domain-containing protein [Frankia sp. CiP1_Cm_nod2]|uniref:DnaJ domain-containing protein n=1 Tax=Frankia sp. CiP1_Cm_nod2 TaxID=2897161 RepID=UPI0020248564
MAVDVDYYAVLGVARDADSKAIEAAVKKSMREWRKRTEAADLGVRQEAEIKVKQIEEARTTLLDEARRAAYDRALAGGVKQPAVPVPRGGGSRNWLEQAEGYLAVGDYHSAAYAAREATQVEGNNAKTWWIRSRANSGLQLWQDALYEARQAVLIEGNNAEYHFALGLVHEQMDQLNDAVDEYRRAGTCDPANPIYELAVGGVYASAGRLDQALPIVEAVYSRHPEDPAANYYLGSVLIDLAERIPKVRQRDVYAVTSREEIDQMRKLANRALALNKVDDEIRKSADQILKYLDRMEQKSFRPPMQWARAALGGAAEGGWMLLIIMFMIVGGFMLLPAILVIAGFASLAQSPGGGFMSILIGAALGWVWYKLSWVPRWKHNKREFV